MERRDPLRAEQRRGRQLPFAWSNWPEEAATDGSAKLRQRALVWRANYHPDGGQLFCPLHGESFVVPLAMPGDDVTPERFVAFWCDGSRGLYIDPNVWHGAVVPLDEHAEFLDRQGRVHARVSVDFAKRIRLLPCGADAPARQLAEGRRIAGQRTNLPGHA